MVYNLEVSDKVKLPTYTVVYSHEKEQVTIALPTAESALNIVSELRKVGYYPTIIRTERIYNA